MSRFKHTCKKCADHPTGKFCIFCVAQTMVFPIEHFVWTHLPGFRAIAGAFGL